MSLRVTHDFSVLVGVTVCFCKYYYVLLCVSVSVTTCVTGCYCALMCVYCVLLSDSQCYWLLLRVSLCYWVLLGVTGCCWVLLGVTGRYWVLLGVTAPWRPKNFKICQTALLALALSRCLPPPWHPKN